MSGSNQAFYAAEAGIHSAVSNWDQVAIDTLVASTGDSLVGSWTTIENRCSYQLVYRRIDGGDTSTKLYSVQSTGQSPGLNGGRRRVGLIMKGGVAVSLDAGVTFGGDLEISGNPEITGDCGGLHSNGDIGLQGNPIIGGDLSVSGTASGGGSPVDTLGNPITPTEGAPSLPLPDLKSTDYCGDADFIFNSSGLGLKVSTTETFDFSGGGTHWGWKWNIGSNIWETDSANIAEGTYCMDGNVQVSKDLGTPGSPTNVTILATGSAQINGNPYMTAAHPDGILIMADGDLYLNGNPVGGNENFEGLVWGGAQCEIAGNPNLNGQFVCKDNPNPPGSETWVAKNQINGNMTLRYMCDTSVLTGTTAGRPLAERMWNHVW